MCVFCVSVFCSSFFHFTQNIHPEKCLFTLKHLIMSSLTLFKTYLNHKCYLNDSTMKPSYQQIRNPVKMEITK